MIFGKREVKRVAPREFFEYATFLLEPTDIVERCHDNADVVGYERDRLKGSIRARRACRKDGSPLSKHWLISSDGAYAFKVTEEIAS